MSDLSQYIFSGLSVGCIYAFVALGLVIVANVTGVYNFATGEYVMLGGMLFAVSAAAGWSLWLATILAVVAVAAVAVLQERLTVAPVRGKLSSLGLVIGTLGVGVAIRGAALLIWKEDPRPGPAYQQGLFKFLGASLTDQVKWVYLTTAVALVLVFLLFRFTSVGRAMRACAINPVAARLAGIRLGRMSMVSFALAGGLCGLIAAVTANLSLIRWDSGITIGLVGFIAAALAGFDSPAKAVLAGLFLGVLENLAAGYISSEYSKAIVYGTLIVYLLARDLAGEEGIIRRTLLRRRASAAGSEDAGDLRIEVRSRIHAVEDYVRLRTQERIEQAGGIGRRALATVDPRRVGLMKFLPLLFVILLWIYPQTTSDQAQLDAAVFIIIAAIAATGLGLVMGLAAQFSLGQAAFMLISGYASAILTANHGWDPLAAAAVAVLLSVVIGAFVGWLTLRLEGLNLALATLAVLVILGVFVLQQDSLTGGAGGLLGVPSLKLFGQEIVEPRSYYRFCLVILAVCMLVARNIYKSRMGRSLKAIGIDEEAARSVGLNAWRLKMKIFVLASAMAGIAGVLSIHYLNFVGPDSFNVGLTINLVTYVVVGGVLSPYGGAVGAVVVGALLFYFREHVGASVGGNSSTWDVFISGILLVIFVLLFRDGLASIPGKLNALVKRKLGKAPAQEPEGPVDDESEVLGGDALGASATLKVTDGDGSATRSLEPVRHETPVVAVEGLTKRFGSLIAVNGLSFNLRPGYVTALIGPNGAGKSTVISLISGTLSPSEGAVGVMGQPVVGRSARQIAELGLARTYQTPRLFEGMTLIETVMLARDRFGSRAWLTDAALRTPRALREERESHDQGLAWLAFVGLADDADAQATSLPVGKQRMAEVARALAAEPAILLLDEPAAGLDGARSE
ncbi:MAG: ATP-binding cassette domain-containing protein, partial [Actinobacteria bacterium]|nr:ATP-binding cassette domain-containing protein [Actinomycetota bacterium]